MSFKPVKQLNAILTQEYFEPTISWAFRVVLALNVPLIVMPLLFGFSYKVIWAAFGAYMLSLLDYRGQHYKKIVIQGVEALLMFAAAMLGLYVSHSIVLSVVAMFFVGMFAALIRNWRDYGSGIGVAVGFFFLFGLASPGLAHEPLQYGLYLLAGAAWSVFITIVTFPLTPASPVKRSVAKVWKANTEFLDALIQQTSGDTFDGNEIIEKEIAVRTVINQSIDHFSRREKNTSKIKANHYDALMELRKTGALFGATLSALHEELEVIQGNAFKAAKDASLYKTLSALGQASARMAIVIYTFRPEDFTMLKIRTKRYEIAVEIFKESCRELKLSEKENTALDHFTDTLHKASGYLRLSIAQIEEKLNFKKGDYFENYKLSFNNFIAGINSQALLDFLRNLANINSDQLNYALRVSIGLCVGVFSYKFFNIDHGYWIPLTMIIVIQPYYGATRKKGFERVVGTVAGIMLGGAIMLLPISHQGFVVLLVIVSFFVAYFLRNNYKVGVFFVTIMMVILMQMSQQASWQLIGWRILSTLIGAILALIAGYAFWPVWEKERFPNLMADALLQTKNYLLQVIKYFNGELPAGETWYRQRRFAEAANNSVFTSVQRMFEEPRHAQKEVDESFAMVGVCIRMAREITSIALLVNENRQEQHTGALNVYAGGAALIFDSIIAQLRSGNYAEIDFTAIKKSLADAAFSNNSTLQLVKIEFEKIIFEMETLAKLNAQEAIEKPIR